MVLWTGAVLAPVHKRLEGSVDELRDLGPVVAVGAAVTVLVVPDLDVDHLVLGVRRAADAVDAVERLVGDGLDAGRQVGLGDLDDVVTQAADVVLRDPAGVGRRAGVPGVELQVAAEDLPLGALVRQVAVVVGEGGVGRRHLDAGHDHCGCQNGHDLGDA